jgi:hypothetical protein
VKWLDCENLASTLSSLAIALGTTPVGLEGALRSYDDVGVSEAREDPWKLVPRQFFERFGLNTDGVTERFDGAYYFHGTRAVDPEAFRRRGLLPLDEMVEELWATLFALVANDVSDEEWAKFRTEVEADGGGHDGWLYRLKTGDRRHSGPYGSVVRETFFAPGATGTHDYLGCPEIVQDIARCFASAYGVDLEQRFCAATRPSIVKFRGKHLQSGAINAAFWYAHTMLREGVISRSSNYGFDGSGAPVAAEDVVAVEILID